MELVLLAYLPPQGPLLGYLNELCIKVMRLRRDGARREFCRIEIQVTG